MKNIDYSFVIHPDGQGTEKVNNYIHHNNLFVVIDGVGRDYLRAKATNLAYSAVLETFFRILEENNSPGDAIFFALKKANRVILEERIKINEKMAASICIFYIEDRIMYFSHLGDSRIYSFQDNELNQLTRDHTLREEDPFAEKRYDDPRALQALIKGLGIHETPDIYIKKYPLEKKGVVILTTERLTERISNRDIQWLSKKAGNPKKLGKSIVELFTRKGGEEGFILGIVKYGVIPEWLRKVLSIYLISFAVIIVVIAGYFIRFSDTDISEETGAIPGQVILEEHADTPATMTEKATIVSQESDKRSIVRQSIVIDRKETALEEKNKKKEKVDITDLFNQVHAFLSEWKTAWELSAGRNGNISKYISYYSEDFRSGRLNKNSWASDKSRKNKRKKWIRVEISNIKISKPDENNRLRIRFSQNYKSSNYSVKSDKILILKEENGRWLIVSERSN